MTDERPLLSVLIAAYNQVQYIRETLNSVLLQTYPHYELVVIDDGSTDGTGAEIDSWADNFRRTQTQRLVVEHTANHGQSGAFEYGAAFCTGDYICLLDADDLWLPEKLSRVAEAALSHPLAGMIVHPLHVIDSSGERTGDIRPMRAKLSCGDIREQVRKTTRQIAPATAGVSIRTDIFRQMLPMPTKEFRSAADSYLTFGASLLAPIIALDEPLGEYRMHSASHYLGRITSAEGLRKTVGLHQTIARHFGIEGSTRNNAYFTRHLFALNKLESTGFRKQAESYRQLVRSTWQDPSYRALDKVALNAFWTICLLAPRPLFGRLWHDFQMRHTGHHRLTHKPKLAPSTS